MGTEDVPDVDTDTLKRYLDYLKQQLEFPCQVTDIESFEWEEYYMYDDGSELEATKRKSLTYQLLDDYATWFVTWRD